MQKVKIVTMQIERFYINELNKRLMPGKVLAIYGPRQVGKTTIVEALLKKQKGKIYRDSGDNADFREVLNSMSLQRFNSFFAGYDIVFIDELQEIENGGRALKLLIDNLRHLKVVVTGSAMADLAGKIGEPLVGRQHVCQLFPIAASELKNTLGAAQTIKMLPDLLIYGSYPNIFNLENPTDKMQYVKQIRDSYLLKDILSFDGIRNSGKILDLLKMLAFRIGKEISIEGIGNALGMGKNTVASYLDLLQKVFIVYNIKGFTRNLDNEITKTSRYYFYDNGIRNAIINNFNSLSQRDDVGALWENFMFMERMKFQNYKNHHTTNYFWRTYTQQEIDLIEEKDGRIQAYEFKYSPGKNKPPGLWARTYPDTEYFEINNTNWIEFT